MQKNDQTSKYKYDQLNIPETGGEKKKERKKERERDKSDTKKQEGGEKYIIKEEDGKKVVERRKGVRYSSKILRIKERKRLEEGKRFV